MKLSALLMAVLMTFVPLSGARSEAEKLQIFGEILPPYAFVEDGQAKGISVDLLVEMLARAGRAEGRSDITFVNWARGYAELQNRPNTLLFSTVRLAEREKLFQWVGPILVTQVQAIARKDKSIHLGSLLDMNNYAVCVSRSSAGHQRLLASGVSGEKLIAIETEKGGARLVARGRVDIWVAEKIMANWQLIQNGFDPADFEAVGVVVDNELSFAFNRATDPAVAQALQDALDGMRADGTYDTILARYLKQTSP